MASLLLDSIINKTVQNFRDLEGLEGENPLQWARLPPNDSSSAAGQALDTNSSAALAQLDQLDGLVSLMQDVEMGQRERLFWILLFSLMVLVAAGGNVIVIYIVSTNKEMKSVTNYFLVNLSLADTMVSTLNVIFNFISMLNRYNAILHPLRPRMSHRHAIGWILLIWTLSSALAMPNIVYSIVVEDRLVNENLALTCTMIWPDGRYPLSSYDHIYNIIILVVTYLVPIFTMAILYYKVGRELWGFEAIGENVEKQARAIMAKKKIVKMMIVVVIIFALCWLPYHGFFVVNYYLPTIFQDGPLLYKRCYLIMYWLAMSNSMYNPIIIYFMNSKFCHEFKRVLWFICCCRTYSPPPQAIKSDSIGQLHHQHMTTSVGILPKARSSAGGPQAAGRRHGATTMSAARSELARTTSRLSKLVIGVPPQANGFEPTESSHASTPIQVVVTQSNDYTNNCDPNPSPAEAKSARVHNTATTTTRHDREDPGGSTPPQAARWTRADTRELEPFLKCDSGQSGSQCQRGGRLGGSVEASEPSSKVWI